MKGARGLSGKKPLTRRHAIRFAFGVDTSEVFYVKFSDIGIPEALLVEVLRIASPASSETFLKLKKILFLVNLQKLTK